MNTAADPATWRPGSTRANLATRAHLLADVRAFFTERGVLEVETPLLGRHTVTEPAIRSLALMPGEAGAPRWLQTSPEYHMKRLLAAGSGPIWQLARCFRAGEAGQQHNPEFSLLEWYRPGYALQELVNEVAELMHALLGRSLAPQRTWHDLLASHTGLDPDQAPDADLAAAAVQLTGTTPEAAAGFDRRDLLDLLYSDAARAAGDCFITEFPVDQAALAEVVPGTDGQPRAARFELVLAGMEVANGYQELTDAQEQRRRFAADVQRRQALYPAEDPAPDADAALLAALEHGLPPCCGVAVGFDRLVMLASRAGHIDAVQAFSWPRA